MYKIYIGAYQKKDGLCPAPTIFSTCPKKHLKKAIEEACKCIKQGMDIYIVNEENEVKAVYRDGLLKKWNVDI